MALKQQIQKDMIEAMKAHEQVKVDSLRLLKAAILKFETSGDRKEASDEDVMNLIAKEVKQRRDSIDEYKKGNREDLAEKEEKELAVLQTYLPKQMDEAELRGVVAEAIAKTGAKSKADAGKVMGVLMPMIKGKADGGMANKIVMSILQ